MTTNRVHIFLWGAASSASLWPGLRLGVPGFDQANNHNACRLSALLRHFAPQRQADRLEGGHSGSRSAVAMRARRVPRDCGDPRDAKGLGSGATVRPRVLARNRLRRERAHRATLDRSRDALPLIAAAMRAQRNPVFDRQASSSGPVAPLNRRGPAPTEEPAAASADPAVVSWACRPRRSPKKASATGPRWSRWSISVLGSVFCWFDRLVQATQARPGPLRRVRVKRAA